MNIDTQYNKELLYPSSKFSPLQRGYGVPRQRPPSSIVIHTTNGAKGSSYEGERNFLYNTKDVSAHFLVGKDGRITQFLRPEVIAYHAGAIFPEYRFYGNPYSIGIENHYTPGEGEWPKEMRQALTELCQYLIKKYDIKLLEAHRRIASPLGRKIDPSGYTDSEFYEWRRNLFSSPSVPISKKYVVTVEMALIRQGPSKDTRIASRMRSGDNFDVSEIVNGESIEGNNKWLHLASEIGFVWSGLARSV